MRPLALLLLAVSVDAGPSCERCKAKDYRIEVEVRNASSYELLRVKVNELPPSVPEPGEGDVSVSVPFQSFEQPQISVRLLVSPPASAPGEERIVLPATIPDRDQVKKGEVLVIEITDAELRTRCTGMSRAQYESFTDFPGVTLTPWDEVPCP